MGRQYTIHEVARLLGISADAIRLYEKDGLVKAKRNERNGYRYYEVEQIHRIMGINLYRQLDVGLAEIGKIFHMPTFGEVSNQFGRMAEDCETQIKALQRKAEKLRFMQQHLDNMQKGLGNMELRSLPARYVLFQNETGGIRYEEMCQILNQLIFSFGNFCYRVEREGDGTYRSLSLEFVVREGMLDICPWSGEKENLPRREECRCLYTVMGSPELAGISWDFQKLYDYGEKQGYSCSNEIYAFYVYSLMNGDEIWDYYEIYLPINEKRTQKEKGS